MTNIPDRGTKCTCAKCAVRFYDLNKRPAVCPKCGQNVALVTTVAVRRKRRALNDIQSSTSFNTPLATTVIAPLPTQKKVRWK